MDGGPRRWRIGRKGLIGLAALVGGGRPRRDGVGRGTVGPLELGNRSSAAALGDVTYVRAHAVDLDARDAYAVDATGLAPS